MNNSTPAAIHLSCATTLLLLTTLACAQQDPRPHAATAATASRFGHDASLAVLPVHTPNDLNRQVGDALGLVLEQGGMTNILPAGDKFEPPVDTAWEAIPAALAEFLRANPPATDYVLYAEFDGQPPAPGQRPRVAAVRAVIIDRNGNVAWQTQQKPGDAPFDQVKPNNPMSCCVLVAECLRHDGLLDSASPASLNTIHARKGRMALLWAERAGLPPATELDAMHTRARQLRDGLKDARLCVYPVLVGEKIDATAASAIAEPLRPRVAEARIMSDELHLDVPGSSNAQKHLWDLARAFQQHVQKSPPPTDYAACVRYIPVADGQCEPRLVVCTRTGEFVLVEMTIQPMSPEACAKWVSHQITR